MNTHPRHASRGLGLGLGMAAAAALLIACRPDDPAKTPSPLEPPAIGSSSAAPSDLPLAAAAIPAVGTDARDAAATERTAELPTAAAAAAAADGGGLTSEQILAITRTASAGEIEQAEIARSKSNNAKVRRLAAKMIRDHREAVNKGDAIARKDSLTPEPSAQSAKLEKEGQTTEHALSSLQGSEFDRSYTDAQLREHEAFAQMLTEVLIPSSTLPDVSAYLHDVKATVEEHLEHARKLQRELEK